MQFIFFSPPRNPQAGEVRKEQILWMTLSEALAQDCPRGLVRSNMQREEFSTAESACTLHGTALLSPQKDTLGPWEDFPGKRELTGNTRSPSTGTLGSQCLNMQLSQPGSCNNAKLLSTVFPN